MDALFLILAIVFLGVGLLGAYIASRTRRGGRSGSGGGFDFDFGGDGGGDGGGGGD